MRSAILKLSVVSLIVAIPAAAAGVVWWSSNTTGLAPESMRAELAEDILREWSPEAAKTYRMTSSEWATRMGPTLAGADIANLERAASAGDLQSMNLALLGNARTLANPTPGATAAKIGTAGSDLVYTPLTPCRIVDTRVIGGPIATNGSRSFAAFTATNFASQGGDFSNCNLPANVSAISVKITASNPIGNGYFTVFPSNEVKPLASSLNYLASLDISNESHFRLCRPGCTTQFTVYSLLQSDLVIDVNGYFAEPEATELDCTVAQQTGNLDLLGGLQPRSVSCPTGYTATGGGCGGVLGIGVSNSQPVVTGGQPSGWSCDLVGSLLSVLSYQVNATCCRIPGR